MTTNELKNIVDLDNIPTRRIPSLAIRKVVKSRILLLMRLLGNMYPKTDTSPHNSMSRLDHCLQMAERVRQSGADNQWVMAALVHDIGHIIPHSDHAAIAADLMEQYVQKEISLVLRWHTLLGQKQSYPETLKQSLMATNFVYWDSISWDPLYPIPSFDSFFEVINEVLGLSEEVQI